MQTLSLTQEGWYDDKRITPWLNTQVVAIDREQRHVVLGTGESLPYDRLILAAGSSTFVPPIKGFGANGSFVLREAADAMRIRAYVQERGCRRAIVVGGGPLGLEAAYALKKLGLHVTVLEINPRLMRRQLDERAAEMLARYLEGLGLEILLGQESAAVEAAHGRVVGVRLVDGTILDADLFLLSAGIVPNAAVAREAGLAVDRGVVVDGRMNTTDPWIFAAGDVAEYQKVVMGLWPTAVEQAKVAATNAVGGDDLYAGTIPVTILKVTGVDLMSVGRFEAEDPDELEIVLEDTAAIGYRKLVIGKGKIVGAILLGYPLEAPGVVRAVKESLDVMLSLDELRVGDWSSLVDQVETAGETSAVALELESQ
jgi:NAD(P)H-nitrite reductase large subunit